MKACETVAKELAPLIPAAVIVAEQAAGEEGTPLSDPALEPDTSDDSGIDPEPLIVPIDTEPLPDIEANREGARVLTKP